MFTKFWNWLFLSKKADRQFAAEVDRQSAGKPVHAFLITKPLQYMNLKAVTLDSSAFNLLIVINAFSDADKFTDYLRKSDPAWDMIGFFDQEEAAQASLLRITKLAAYWNAMDYGVKNNFFMRELHQRNCRIRLIEEGVGNYVKSNLAFAIYHPFLAKHRWISKLCFEWVRELFHRLSGCGNGINSSKWSEEIYLYYPQYPHIPCLSRSVLRKFEFSPVENFKRLGNFFDCSAYPWLDKIQNQKVLILSTSWDGTAVYDDNDLKNYDVLIVKYHPHLKDKQSCGENQVKYLAGSLPTEILAIKLLNQGCTITMRAKFTSSFVYLLGSGIKLEFETEDIPAFLADYFHFVEQEVSKGS